MSCSAEVRDVDALDAPRQRRQAQSILDAREPLVDVGLRAAFFLEGVPRVFAREIEELPPRAALGRHDVHRARAALSFGGERDAPFAQPLGDAFGAFGKARHDHFVRNVRLPAPALAVVLAEKARDELVVRDFDAPVRKRRRVDHASGAHDEQHELGEVALAVHAEHVLVAVRHRHDALGLAHQIDRLELIPIARRELELERLARRPHALFEHRAELVVAPFEKEPDRAHLLRVELPVHLVHARRGAALDLELQAGPLAARELAIRAGAELQMPLDEVERAARGRRRVVRAEVARPVEFRTAHELEPRPGVLGGEPDGEVLLVVAELDVVAGLALLDETVLEDRGFLLGRRDDRLEVGDLLAQKRDERARVGTRVLEIAANARAQALRLAHVESLARRVAKDVAARLSRQERELRLEIRGGCLLGGGHGSG